MRPVWAEADGVVDDASLVRAVATGDRDALSTLYARRDWTVVSNDTALSDARMLLASATRQALLNGLTWLGIPVPDRM